MRFIKFVEVELESSMYLTRQVTNNRMLNLLLSPQDIKTCLIHHQTFVKIPLFLDIPGCKIVNKNCGYQLYYHPRSDYTFRPKQTAQFHYPNSTTATNT